MAAQTIFVRSLPELATNERLEEIFSEVGPVKQCFVVKEKGADKCRGFGYVTYAMEEDAQRALKEIKDYDGRKLSLSVAKKKIRDKKKAAPKEPDEEPKETEPKSKGFRKKTLKSRLIIRNLSFKCSEGDLKNVFSKFGTVIEAKIPLKPDGKMRGFAFVMFKNVCEASQALKAMNLKEINGRQVAVDWAVPKDKYVANNPASSAAAKNKEEETPKPAEKESEGEDEEVGVKNQEPSQKSKAPLKATLQSVRKEEPQSEEEEEDDDDDDDDSVSDEEEEDEELEGGEDEKSSVDSEDDDDEQEDDEEDDDDDEEDDEEQDLTPKKAAKKKILPSDVNQGRTVFIRNLSFDTEEEGLEEILLQFGEINYIKIVLHPDTEHSKGCAFAQFKTKEAADKCIAASEDDGQSGGLRLDGRKLFIVAAVTREDAVKLKVDKKKVESGTRNLFLAREGLIRAGTKAAEGLSEAEMAKRARFAEVKRTKLRDQSIFVSKTRLCVHNLPKSVDQKKLRALCLQPFKGGKRVQIVECRVMYDKKPQKGQVMGHSLGYGFVQFQEHEHALATLRYLNNNPEIFGEQKRPIVEFSLEDLRKLKIKEMRHQKNKEHFKRQKEKQAVQPQTRGDGQGFKKGGSSAQFSKPTRKHKAVQHQEGDAKYSGFQTRPEVEYVELQDGKKRKKVLPLPSHHGPKNRMRDKGKQQAPPAKKARPGQSRKDRQRRQLEKPTQPRKQERVMKKPARRREGDRFDSLVEQYKKKLMANSDGNSIRRSKWFNS